MTQAEKKQSFTIIPNSFFFRKDLSALERGVLEAIMCLCPYEGAYGLSYRQIATVAGISHTLLGAKKKQGKKGILDKIEQLGYISVVTGKEVNPLTGKPQGHAQTFIYVHHSKIWADHDEYCKRNRMPVNLHMAHNEITITDESGLDDSILEKFRHPAAPSKADEQREQTPKRVSRSTELQTMPYPEYLKTPEWAAKRTKALRFAGYRCQMCNVRSELTVHHRTYERRGHELLNDLIVLCKDCHDTFTFNRELSQ